MGLKLEDQPKKKQSLKNQKRQERNKELWKKRKTLIPVIPYTNKNSTSVSWIGVDFYA
tara:strand:+ start:436 stop:609 length:174 start_codon:yes stop_codon:yes gene_type:complete